MSKAVRLTPEQRMNLVAYLDRELSDAEARGIDAALGDSPVARHEVEALSRTWELLDLLDRPAASASFLTRTMETIHLGDLPRPKLWDQPWVEPAKKVAMLIAAAASFAAAGWCGAYLGQQAFPRREERLLRELPLLQKMDAYEEAGDVEFLRRLKSQNVFEE